MTNASTFHPFKPLVRHSIDRTSEIQTGWTFYKYNGCVWTGFSFPFPVPTARGDSVPSKGSSPTGGLGWTIRWQIYHFWYLLKVFPLGNTMRTSCPKDGGMVNREGENLSPGTITRTRKKIMIQLSPQSAITMNICLLFYILLENDAWQNIKKKRWLISCNCMAVCPYNIL